MRNKSQPIYLQQEIKKIDAVKKDLCAAIKKIALSYGWNQKLLAWHLGTSEARVSHVIRCRVEQLTLNQLFRYLARLKPEFRFLLSI